MKSNGNSHVSTGKSGHPRRFIRIGRGEKRGLLLIDDEQGTVIISSSRAQDTCRTSNQGRLYTASHP
ncbi:hypothetical protein YC2023_018056 [Brassica napus]